MLLFGIDRRPSAFRSDRQLPTTITTLQFTIIDVIFVEDNNHFIFIP